MNKGTSSRLVATKKHILLNHGPNKPWSRFIVLSYENIFFLSSWSWVTMPIHEYCTKREEENWLLKPTITLDNIVTTYRQIRDLKTVRRGRLRGHDNQRHFGGKTWKPSSSSLRVLARMSYWWKQVVTNNVRSFINLQSGEDLIFFNKKHCVNFSGKKN